VPVAYCCVDSVCVCVCVLIVVDNIFSGFTFIATDRIIAETIISSFIIDERSIF